MVTTTSTMAEQDAEATRRAVLQAAFRHLHGQRLHGFCLLLALGDRAVAASAASEALAAALPRLGEMRHPERAAAWLRAHATSRLVRRHAAGEAEAHRRETLRSLGVSDAVFDGLAALTPRDRAAIVAAGIERLAPLDVEVILGAEGSDARRIVDRARQRYLSAATRSLGREGGLQPPTGGGPPGQLAARITEEAERALGGSWGAR